MGFELVSFLVLAIAANPVGAVPLGPGAEKQESFQNLTAYIELHLGYKKHCSVLET